MVATSTVSQVIASDSLFDVHTVTFSYYVHTVTVYTAIMHTSAGEGMDKLHRGFCSHYAMIIVA